MRVTAHRCFCGQATRNAIVAAAAFSGAVAATMPTGSLAQNPTSPPISIYASLIGSTQQRLIELSGQDDRDPSTANRFTITGSLRRLPCSRRTYRFVMAAVLGRVRVNYDATLVLRQVRGDRIRCDRQIPVGVGTTTVRLRIYLKGQPRSDAAIIVKGTRTTTTKIKGSLTNNGRRVCSDAMLEAKFISPRRTVSLVYEMSFKGATINGRTCS
jgi:hypothetical protein